MTFAIIILWYNEEDQIFEEMPTTRDAVNSTVSTTTMHFSQYMVVDSAKWYENWENSLNWLRTMWIGGTTYSRDIHTIFLIDCSQSMSVSDNISYSIEIGYNGVTEENYSAIISDMDSLSDVNYYLHNYGRRHCYRTSIPENVINNKGSDDLIKIITFSNSVEEDSGFSRYYSWLKKYIQKVNNDGNQANLDSAISQAFNNIVLDSVDKYRFIVLTDNNINVSDNVLNHNWNNSDLIFVNLGDTPFRNQIDYLATETGGTTYDAISASDLTYESSGVVNVPEQYVGTDSDGDGIPDLVEQYGLKPNVDLINTNPYDVDTDGDGINDNDELGYVIGSIGSNATIADYVKALNPHSDPTKIDSDNDGLDDYLETILGTKLLNADTDCDNLSDGYEVELWYDPTDPNPDGDSYNDYYELQNDTNPFVYNMTAGEAAEAFTRGGLLGDFDTADDIETLCGQIAFSFVPFAADARDYFANVFVNQDTGAAILNLGGFLLDFIPGAGSAGDAAKAFPKLARFISKYADDAPKVIDAIIQATKQFPNADEVIPGLIKVLPVGAMDEVVDAVKNGDKVTKADYKKLAAVLEASGKNADEALGFIAKNANEINFKPQNLIDELVASGNKFSLDKVEFVVKTPEGELLWLEYGDEGAGLYHILYGSSKKSWTYI